MEIGGREVVRDTIPKSAGVLCRHAEVPSIGVGLCAAHHPGGWCNVIACVGIPNKDITPGTLSEGKWTHVGIEIQQNPSQAFRFRTDGFRRDKFSYGSSGWMGSP